MKSDLQLLTEYLNDGSQTAFSTLVNRYIGLVWATATRVNQSSIASDDIAQQTFLLLARKASELRNHTNLGGWLHRTSYLLALNELRSQRRAQQRQQDRMDAMNVWSESEQIREESDISANLDEMLQRLRDQDRQLILLRYFQNYRWADIAETLKISEGAAKMSLRRALDKLRCHFERAGIITTVFALNSTLEASADVTAKAGSFQGLKSRILQDAAFTLTTSSTRKTLGLPRMAAAGVALVGMGWVLWHSAYPKQKIDSIPSQSQSVSNPPTESAKPILELGRRTHASAEHRLNEAESALRTALNDREHPSDLAVDRVRRALDLFGHSADRAVPILIEVLAQSTDLAKSGRWISDYYYVGKEHFLALHGIQYLGPRGASALDFLLAQLRQENIPSQHLYPETIRTLQPSPRILPELLSAMGGSYFVQNAMGRSLAELVAELAQKDPQQHQLTIEHLRPVLSASHPTLRTTAAYALSFLVENATRHHLRVLHDAITEGLDPLSPLPPRVTNTQEFMRAIMRKTASDGDTEGRRRLAILGVGQLGAQANESLLLLMQIARTHRSDHTRRAALEAIASIAPGQLATAPDLLQQQTRWQQIDRLNERLHSGEPTESDLLAALQLSETRLDALKVLKRSLDLQDRVAPSYIDILRAGKGDGLTILARHIAQEEPTALLPVLQSTNHAAIRSVATALGELGAEAVWALPHLVFYRSNLVRKSHTIELAIKQISTDWVPPVVTYNVLPEAVSAYLESQSAGTLEEQLALWQLFYSYGPNLSVLPKPGVEQLAKAMHGIDPRYGQTVLATLTQSHSQGQGRD